MLLPAQERHQGQRLIWVVGKVSFVCCLKFGPNSRDVSFARSQFAGDFLPIPAQPGVVGLYHVANVYAPAKYGIERLVGLQG